MAAEDLGSGPFHTIVVSTDGTPFSARAVAAGFRFAKRDHAKLIIISVVDTTVLSDFVGAGAKEREKAERELEANAEEALAAAGKMAGREGVDAELIIKRGRPHIEIVTVAGQAEADLIILGKRSGYRAGRRLLGNVTQRVLEDADCSVLIVS